MWESNQGLGEESLTLLREQATKLKTQSRDLELKEEQVRFLKETILAMEQEKDCLAHHNHQLKQKLKTMAAEITNYNSSVVQQVYRQNQELLQAVEQLTSQNQQLNSQNADMEAKISELESLLQGQGREKVEQAKELQQLRETSSKQDKKVGLLEKQNKEFQHKNISLQRQVEDSSSQIAYCSQQIDILTQKHHEALKANEKKVKQVVEKMVPKEDFQTVERELKETGHRCKQLKDDLDRAVKEKQKMGLELLGYREKMLDRKIMEETETLQIKTDLSNLVQSLKMGKQITQFESSQHLNMEQIYEISITRQQQAQKLTSTLLNCQNQLREKESILAALEETLKAAQVEVETLREEREAERESLQSHYEGKLIEISVRLRREEIALAQLRGKEAALESLQEQFEQEVQDRKVEKETLNNTICQLRKENGQVTSQLSQTLQFCQGNMNSWQSISHFKYTIQELVAVVHYLHQRLLTARHFSQRVLAPLLTEYFRQGIPAKSRSPFMKVRRCVWVLVALQRMRKEQGRGSSLQRHVFCALERRQKIENLGEEVEKMSSLILQGMKTRDILQECEGLYRWAGIAYPKIVFQGKLSS